MDLEKYMVPCMSKRLFGVECPGCGMQRAMLLVAKGEFSAAFHMYPAVYTSILFFSLLGLHFADKSRNYSKVIIASATVNAVVMIVSYIYKMTNV